MSGDGVLQLWKSSDVFSPSAMQPLTQIHVPLQYPDEIRVLTLQPHSKRINKEDIRCSLSNVRLSASPLYEALSYMWGEEDMKTIQVGGLVYEVRRNLWDALRYLRRANRPRALWIDALCIDQLDTEERNHQVGQMSRVYSQASRVVVWLGMADETSRRALDFVNSLPRGNVSPTHFSRPILQSVQSLCCRPYWSRLWIVQELLLAGDIQLYCGNQQLKWDRLFSVLKSVSFFYRTQASPRNKYSTATDDQLELAKAISASMPYYLSSTKVNNAPQDGRTNKRNTGIYTLFELCSTYGTSECEDVRDKVFGLHSMADACCRAANHIDYSLSFSQICGVVLMHHVTHHGHYIQHRRLKLLVKELQRFHSSMRIGLPHCMHSLEQTYPSAGKYARNKGWSRWAPAMGPPVTSVAGEFKSRVSHMIQLDVELKDRALSLRRLSRLSDASIASIRQLYHTLCIEKAGSLPVVNWQFDLVNSFREAAPGSFRARPFRGEEVRKIVPSFGSSQNSLKPLRSQIVEIVNTFKSDHPGSPVRDFSIAFAEDGLICLVPVAARAGDLLISFHGSNIIAVGRAASGSSSSFELFGRGVSFLVRGRNAIPDSNSESHTLSGPARTVDIRFPISTLQLLTRASDNLNPIKSTAHPAMRHPKTPTPETLALLPSLFFSQAEAQDDVADPVSPQAREQPCEPDTNQNQPPEQERLLAPPPSTIAYEIDDLQVYTQRKPKKPAGRIHRKARRNESRYFIQYAGFSSHAYGYLT